MKPQPQNINALESYFLKVATHYCEAICIENSIKPSTNLFGEKIAFFDKNQMATLFGYAITGKRSSVFVDASNFRDYETTLRKFSKNKVPLTVVVQNGNELSPAQLCDDSIVFQVSADHNLQHWMVLAQSIAEAALTSVYLLVVFESTSLSEPQISKPFIDKVLGNPQEFKPATTRAQKFIFGNRMRILPNWQSLDVPVLSNSGKSGFYKSLNKASNDIYYKIDYQNIIDVFILQLNELLGVDISIGQIIEERKAKLGLLLPVGVDTDSVREVINQSKNKVSTFKLNQLKPFPTQLFEDVKNLNKIAVAEPIAFNGYAAHQLANSNFGKIAIHGIQFHHFEAKNTNQIIDYLAHCEGFRSQVYLDIPILIQQSKFPKHQLLIQNIQRRFPEAEKQSLLKNLSTDFTQSNFQVPELLRVLKDEGPLHSKVSRFFQDTSIFKDQIPGELVADPFQALSSTPIATSSLGKLEKEHEANPVLALKNCTGCLACLSDCPHMAINASLFNIDELLKEAIQKARKRGVVLKLAVGAMRDLTGAAYKIIHQQQGKKLNTLGGFFKPAIDLVLSKLSEDVEKQQALSDEFKAVLAPYYNLEITITQKHFWEAESSKEGSGKLFTIGIDPVLCTGCGICAERCDENAIYQEKGATISSNQIKLIDLLPDTSGENILQLTEDEDVDPFAALMLSRFFNNALVGGESNEENALHQILMHCSLTLTEEVRQARVNEHLKAISKIVLELSGLIKKQLSGALPTAHLESLTEVVAQHNEERLTVDKILAEWGEIEGFKVVNKPELENTLTLIDQLNRLKTLWQEGPTGIGRARYSVVLGKGFEWAATYPNNPLKVPSLYDQEAPFKAALGLFEGLLAGLLENFRLIRKAELVAKKQYKPHVHDAQLASLNWQMLTDEERNVVSPVLIFCDAKQAHYTPEGLSALLASGYPIKVILSNKNELSAENIKVAAAQSTSPNLLLRSNLSCYVARVGLSNRRLLFKSLLHVLKTQNTGAVEVVMPDVWNLNISPLRWNNIYHIMLNTRMLNEFTFNDTLPLKSIGEKLDVSSNPDFEKLWTTTSLEYEKQGEKQELPYIITWADWAFLHTSLAEQFEPVEVNEKVIQVADYLKDKSANAQKTPVVIRVSDKNELTYFKVSEVILEGVEAVVNNVQFLQEISGLYTKFPEKLKHQVEKELEVKYENELNQVKSALAKEKAAWEEQHTVLVRDQIKEQLVRLSKMGEKL